MEFSSQWTGSKYSLTASRARSLTFYPLWWKILFRRYNDFSVYRLVDFIAWMNDFQTSSSLMGALGEKPHARQSFHLLLPVALPWGKSAQLIFFNVRMVVERPLKISPVRGTFQALSTYSTTPSWYSMTPTMKYRMFLPLRLHFIPLNEWNMDVIKFLIPLLKFFQIEM